MQHCDCLSLVKIIMLFFIVSSCSKQSRYVKNKIFTQLSVEETGIDFSNTLTENDSLNYFNYAYIYMGGGVAAGDINNDGLIDLFFTGNMVSNRLYINKGGLQFEDISEKAGLLGDERWFTGVTMADVNNDGFLDIYCSVGGKFTPKENLLYINNGDQTFTESAKAYGINDIGNSVQATFFDYDRDGDLDLYLMNMPSNNIRQKLIYQKENKIPYTFSDKLYKNLGRGKFVDETKKAGIENYAFGLGLIAADINQDGWTDIYVACDYEQPDRYFINNQDGSFSNRGPYDFKHTEFLYEF